MIPQGQLQVQRAGMWRDRLAQQTKRAQALLPPAVEGTLTRMVGLALEATGCQAAVGDICDLLAADGSRVEAEVVGFGGERLLLMPTSDVQGLAPSARVIPRPARGPLASAETREKMIAGRCLRRRHSHHAGSARSSGSAQAEAN